MDARTSTSKSLPSCSELEFDPELHRYYLDGRIVPSVTGVLKAASLIDDQWFDDWSRDRGSAVHQICQYLDEGDLDIKTVDPRLFGYLDAYKKFRREVQFDIQGIELKVASAIYGYAGTLDRWGFAGNGLPILVDIKTGALSPPVGIQLTGYQLALLEWYNIHCFKLFGLQLKEDGTYKMKEYKADMKTWQAALIIRNWKAA